MSLIYEILKEISSTSLKYKGIHVNLFCIPKFKNYSKNSLSGTLSYLHKNGFIEGSDFGLQITHKGQRYIKKKMDSLKKFYFSMIQKSVWVGPSLLPKEFLDYIEKIKIKDGLKTFKLAKGYNFTK